MQIETMQHANCPQGWLAATKHNLGVVVVSDIRGFCHPERSIVAQMCHVALLAPGPFRMHELEIKVSHQLEHNLVDHQERKRLAGALPSAAAKQNAQRSVHLGALLFWDVKEALRPEGVRVAAENGSFTSQSD